MNISQSTFYNIYSQLSGSLIKTEGANAMYVDMTIDTTTVQCKVDSIWTNYLTNVEAKLTATPPVSDMGALIYLENGVTGRVNSTLNTFEKCYTADTGGIFYMPANTLLNDTKSTFS